MSKKSSNPHRGSSLDAFLEEEGILEDATAKAVKKALAWQLAKAMKMSFLTIMTQALGGILTNMTQGS